MHRLPLALAALAVLGSIVSAVLFFRIGNSKQLLAQRLADADARAGRLDAALASAQETTGALKARVAQLDGQLAGARSELAASAARADRAEASIRDAEARAAAAERTAADTKAVLQIYEETAQALAVEIAALRADLDDVRTSHASPEAVAAYKATIVELEKQLAAARTAPAAPGAPAASTAVFTNRAGRATILSVGPSSAFVVLNFGSARGAQVGHRLGVSQGGTEIAVLMISDVRANYSVAQVVPDSLRGVLQKGDLAILIRPSP